MVAHLVILLILICPPFAWTQEPPPGCPENAFCTPEMGNIRANWLKAIKSKSIKKIERFRINTGVPLGFWSNSPQKDAISWNSVCGAHNTENYKLYWAEIFVKKLSARKEFILEKAWKQNKNGKIQSYPIPRGEVPGFIDNTSLVFIREEEGVYYGLRISHNGSLHIFKYPKGIPTSQSINCPKDLVTAFEKHFQNINIYQDHHCKQIWNTKTKNYEKMIFGLSCL